MRTWRGVTGWLVVIGLEFVCLGLFELFAWVCWRPVVLGWVMALGGCCVWFALLRCCVCAVGWLCGWLNSRFRLFVLMGVPV